MLAIIVLVSVIVIGVNLAIVYFIRHRTTAQQLVLARRDGDLPRAMKVVWVDLFGLSLDLAPKVIWVGGDILDCAGGKGWNSSQGCVAGLSWQSQNASGVAWPEGTTKISQTSFGHEMRHAKTWHTGENSNHDALEFQDDVVKINASLVAAGL